MANLLYEKAFRGYDCFKLKTNYTKYIKMYKHGILSKIGQIFIISQIHKNNDIPQLRISIIIIKSIQ